MNGTASVASFLQQDVRQWALVHHDDFESKPEGWNTKLVSSCDGNDHHIAGHCNDVNGLVRFYSPKQSITVVFRSRKRSLVSESTNLFAFKPATTFSTHGRAKPLLQKLVTGLWFFRNDLDDRLLELCGKT